MHALSLIVLADVLSLPCLIQFRSVQQVDSMTDYLGCIGLFITDFEARYLVEY